MKKIVNIAQDNKSNLESLHEGVEFARSETKKILHGIKGKEMTRKWITVFLLFSYYTVVTLAFENLSKDILVVLTGFGVIFGIVYYAFKPFLEKFKLNSYKQLVLDLAPLFEHSIFEIKVSMNHVKEAELDFENIFIIDEDNKERIDLDQDITQVDLTERQIYTHIVNVLSTEEEDVSIAAAKLCVSKLSEIPYHMF